MILEVKNLCKSFGGLKAIEKLNLTVEKGEITGLIGPNGSGKTTFFNMISGLLRPDKGTIIFNGKDITGLPPHEICRSGIARTFQLTKPFARLSPLKNVMVGRIYGCNPAKSMKQAKEESCKLLQITGLDRKHVPIAAALGLVDRKRLEIARALGTNPKLLLLDEMMAGLNSREIEDVIKLIQEIKGYGVTIILVEHVLKAVLKLSDRVIVLNAGEKIAEGYPHEVITNKKVVEAYLGEEQHYA